MTGDELRPSHASSRIVAARRIPARGSANNGAERELAEHNRERTVEAFGSPQGNREGRSLWPYVGCAFPNLWPHAISRRMRRAPFLLVLGRIQNRHRREHYRSNRQRRG